MSAPMDTTGDEKVDEALYSRQLYVFGHEAQRRMGQTNVLIVGMKGLGVETAKNVILAGVKSVGILDNSKVETGDLSAQFYLTPADVGRRTRAEASLSQLTELNNYVRVTQVNEELSEQVIEKGQYHVVVLTERLVSEQIRIGDYCHAHGIKFITADVRGAFVSVFVDLGDEHVVSDPDGEQPLRGLISHVSNSAVGVVTCHDESRHGLSNGDLVTFEEVEGMTQLNGCPPQPVRVISPYSFSIGDTSSFGTYTGTKGYFQQVKAAKTLKFQPLSAVIKKPEIVSDFVGTSAALHCIYNALSTFQEQNGGRLPHAHVDTDANAVVKLAQSFASSMESKTEIDEKWAFQVARCAAAHLNALAAIGGGIVGQEVLKASSGKFGPIQQFYYFDGTSMLPAPVTDLSIYTPQNSRYDSQIIMFGRDIHHTLTQTSYFLVGAGAIGCEMLKNFAMMGIATNGKGRVHVTDMDTIELSNLNRQFLFRPSDVGQLKSVAAAREAVKMNPDMRVDAQSLRVSPQTEDVYDDTFWESLNGVITALDNVEARIYVDQRCIYYQKPMIDSGTLGTKGSTQVIVPFMTESYGSSRDPAEESIPICTLKNFPNKIEHTIQWARDHFEGDFKQGPEEVNNYLSNPNYLTELAKQPNVQLQNLHTIHNYLVAQKPITFEQCIEWARLQFEIEFNHKIRQLLSVFPPDAKTAEGAAFWSGPKRPPTPLIFSSSDPLHLDFIIAASNLRAFNYGLKAPENSPAYYQRVLETVKVPEYVNQQVKIATTDSEHKQLAETVDDDHDQKVRAAVEKLPSPSSLAGYRLNPIEFEKDNDANYHIAYIAATSNLRARNYAIKEESRHQTKFIAGKIIPAIATTTALVTGLVCVEMYKLIQKKVLEQYRNYTVNLALPLFASAEPIAPATQTVTLKGKEWKWSLWDRIDVDQGDMTLEQFIKYFDTEYGLEVTMLSHGRAMLYYSFGAAQKKIKQRLPMKMSQVVETVGQITLNPKSKYLILEVTVADESGEDIEIPYVRFKFRP